MMRGFSGLISITETVLDAELAALRRLSSKVDSIRDEIAALQNEKTAFFGTDHESIANSDRWLVWAARRNRALNAALAKAMSERERQKKRTELAFGRAEVTKALAAKNDKARRITAIRRGV